MLCPICEKLDCNCDGKRPDFGPKPSIFPVGLQGSQNPYKNAVPKTTSSGPRIGVGQWDNSPKQPPLNSK